jgi:hypothetical protein
MIFKILKFTGKTILYIITLLLIIIVIEYITCPIYRFQTTSSFSGQNIYNPYRTMNPEFWKKANFQVQSYAWLGITSGRKNSNEEIYSIYKSLGYDIISTSDYQKINRYRSIEADFIPVYEHGYGIKKNHQVLIGARKVLWTDYPVFQSIHNKQHILNLLRHDNELIFIAHPKLREGYDPGDMKLLNNYDGIEVLNNYRTSLAHWDSALSAGNYVTIIGDDDSHDIKNPDEIGHHCTFINSLSNNRDDIIRALKSGCAFGARIERTLGESFEAKIKRTKVLPIITTVKVANDSFLIAVDSLARQIRFIGQGGRLLKTSYETDSAFYIIENSDTYIRTEIEFHSGNIYFLNPVCRTSNLLPAKIPPPEIDHYKTNLLRILGFSTLIFIFINYFVIRKRIRKKIKAG